MSIQKVLFGLLASLLCLQSVQAQTFETRCTRYSGDKILQELESSGNHVQIELREVIIGYLSEKLPLGDSIETFFNGCHMGLIVYRNRLPFELLGFWDPDGNPVDGGSLSQGNGEIRTPFNRELIQNFKSESVVYAGGIKNGPCFYYCDCSSVLRSGTFTNNRKTGLWKEFHASGEFIRQKQLELPPPPDGIKDIELQKDILAPAHCMMRPDLKECPNLGGKGK